MEKNNDNIVQSKRKNKREARIDAALQIVAPSVTILFPLMCIIWPLVAIHILRDACDARRRMQL
jgi:hypothetical protein